MKKFECLTCGSPDVNGIIYYFATPHVVIVKNSYLLCDQHKNLRYRFKDIYDENLNRKEIDHQAVKLRIYDESCY